MIDRVCPGCGKAVLSVATRCPRCGYAFETRYDRQIDPKPLRPRVPGPALIVIAIIVVVSANYLWKSGRGGSHDSSTTPTPPVPAALTARTDSIPAKPQPVAVAPKTDGVAAPKPQPLVLPPPAPTTAPAPQPPPREPKPARGAERRFATTWINVRAVRSNKSKVVRILKPGEAVQVDSLGEGWYKIISGEPGYADRRLLASSPPPQRD